MKKALPLLVILLLAGSAWLAWQLGRSAGAAPIRKAQAPTVTEAAANQDEADADVALNGTAAAVAPVYQPTAYPQSPRGAIRGEATLTFDSRADYEAALELLREAGVPVLRTIPGLNAIRISTSNPAWRKIGFDPSDVGYSFPISIPQPAIGDSPYQGAPSVGFIDKSVLQFLGVEPGSNADWGAGIKIAVLDSGVDLDHVAFDGANITALTENVAGDPNGHGTSVISLIAGQSETVPGLAPAAEILSIQTLDADGLSNTFAIAEGIVAAVDAGARIISMSLGSYGDSPVLHAAVNYALDQGIVIVAAVGNDGANQVAYPAAYDGVLAVGANGGDSRPSGFSNYGPEVDIAAPGVGIPAASSGNQYISFTGTSASTPLVTSAVAVALQQNPHLTGQQVVDVILKSANDGAAPGNDPFLGAGVLNVQRALEHGQRGIYDVAVADHYLNVAESTPNAYQVDVLVENRGTEYLNGVQLTVEYEGRTASFYLGGLNAGESTSQPILLNPGLLDNPEGISIISTITDQGTDIRPENDTRSARLQLATPEVED